jgi:5,10-methenyltetrahydrofolate synthetase
VFEEKAALRKRVLAARDAMNEADRAHASTVITRALTELPEYTRALAVAAYMSIGGEFATGEFVRRVLNDGKLLLLPRIDKSNRTLDLYMVADPVNNLRAGVWGIREPDPQVCLPGDVRSVDFVLVPGVAFDRRGNRLGYGGGYYDKLLASMPQRPARVAAAFALQIVDTIPHGANDIPVDCVVTERERIVTGAKDNS